MANEWTIVELLGPNNDGSPRRYTIADGASVSKGQVLELLDNRTVQVISGFEKPIAGVASEEHLPSVGVTSIASWTDGIFRATSSGAAGIIIGAMLTSGASDNTVTSSGAIETGAGHAFAAMNTHGSIRALDAVATGTELSVRLKV